MTTPVYDFVKGYADSRTARFHMPGHKGVGGLGAERLDLTEIKGADELFAADGIIAESENNATELFSSAHSYYSTEGSTLAIKAMLTLAAEEREQGTRPLFVAARNAHKAFVYGVAMLDAEVKWIYSDDPHICKCKVTPSQVEEAIKICPRRPDGVYITSPDYLGNIADVGGIAEVCDRMGVPLLVDNAHGAYLAFLEENIHPLALGASMCADSAHKTLPVLTGGAYLHIAKKATRFCRSARSAMSLYASTSPSYLVLASLDLCNKAIAERDKVRWAEVAKLTDGVRKSLAKSNVVTEGDEPFKLVINARLSGYEGDELAEYFRKREIEPEFCDNDYIVLMISPSNSPADIERLMAAIGELHGREAISREPVVLPVCRAAMSIREAVFAPSKSIDARFAQGRICAAPTVSCPPAVPVAVSGEVISAECVRAFEYYGIEKIRVVK